MKTHSDVTHTGVRSHMCSECDKTFTTSGNLKRHQRLHTGQKPYKCSRCETCFARAEALQKHERLHKDGQSYTETRHLDIHKKKVRQVHLQETVQTRRSKRSSAVVC